MRSFGKRRRARLDATMAEWSEAHVRSFIERLKAVCPNDDMNSKLVDAAERRLSALRSTH